MTAHAGAGRPMLIDSAALWTPASVQAAGPLKLKRQIRLRR